MIAVLEKKTQEGYITQIKHVNKPFCEKVLVLRRFYRDGTRSVYHLGVATC